MADMLPCKRCGHYAVMCDDHVRYLNEEIARLEQFIEHIRKETQDPSIWVDLDAAMEGQYLYQQMPGWADRKPLERPPETQEAPHE